jgi:hypothetical protein
MDEQWLWFLAPGAVSTPAEVAVSVPRFSEVQPRWVHDPEDLPEYLEAPTLFTTKEAAEEQWRYLHDFGVARRDYEDSLPLLVFKIGCGELLEKLEYSHFLCVMLDDKLRRRRDIIEELRAQHRAQHRA